VTVRITCRTKDTTGCNGTIRLASTKKVRVGARSKTFVLGTRSFSIGSGKSVRVTFKLSRANRSALRRLKRVKLTARVTERAAQPRTAKRSLTLRR